MNTPSRLLLACGIVALALTDASFGGDAPPATAPAATWLQWRGPSRDGRAPVEGFPNSLKADRLRLLWRAEVAEGYSSPIVTDDRVFTVETRNREREVVRALDRATGKQLWATDWAGSMKVPFFAARNGSWVRATPASDGQRLYVAGMRDVLVCIEMRDGSVVWRVDFMERHKTPLPAFGFVSSPLLEGEHMYVQAAAGVVKLEKATGKTLWRSLIDGGAMWNSAFSSPMRARIGGAEQLVVQARNDLAGLDPATGKVLWTTPIKAFRGMNILNPTILGDRVFTWSYGGGSYAFDIKQADNAWTATSAWEGPTEGYMSTPVVLEGHAYLLRRDKRLTCVHLQSGEETWASKERFGEYSSLVTDGKMILALDEKGTLRLVRANPRAFELLDTRQVSDEETWAHVTVCGDQVFVRELRAMAVYRWR